MSHGDTDDCYTFHPDKHNGCPGCAQQAWDQLTDDFKMIPIPERCTDEEPCDWCSDDPPFSGGYCVNCDRWLGPGDIDYHPCRADGVTCGCERP